MWHQDTTFIQWLLRLEKELWNPAKLEAVIHLFPWWRGKILKNMEEMVHKQVFGKTGNLVWPHGVQGKSWGVAVMDTSSLTATSAWNYKDHRLKGSHKMHKVKISFLLLGKQFPHHLQKLPSVPTPSSLCSPDKRPMNPRFKVLKARDRTLFGELADQEDGRLMSQNNHRVWVWMPGSFMNQRWREVKKQKGD